MLSSAKLNVDAVVSIPSTAALHANFIILVSPYILDTQLIFKL
ncbi:hypothetical protein ACI8B_290179 [Acinetobacter proteolyticus]|uniref:Uncharacterized protein n=1 Tax=Acinetobacter proteolyticus TaxID=1776741 RepID=A0A653K7N0_9GAMM|nr:hypothetical protein ACI8B_290179 [Acinetobacter proteolyticus]